MKLSTLEDLIMRTQAEIEVAPTDEELTKLDKQLFELNELYETMTGSGNDQED